MGEQAGIKKHDLVIISARPHKWRVVSTWQDARGEHIARIEADDSESLEYAVIRTADLRVAEPAPAGVT